MNSKERLLKLYIEMCNNWYSECRLNYTCGPEDHATYTKEEEAAIAEFKEFLDEL